VGNPSDGFFGKTIALCFTNFAAEVTLYETPELEILPNTRDHSVFTSVAQLADDVRCFGYYGGIRLVKAAVKRFYEYCIEQGIELSDRNFTIRYASDIPHLVGLAGSSAIICACFRALRAFYGVTIPRPVEANLILSVETDELGISAGLQDRVAQVYQGLVFMDFDRDTMLDQGYGIYRELDPGLLPPLYIAYRADLSEGSEIVHNDLHARFRRGEKEATDAVAFWADLTEQVRSLLEAGRGEEIGELLDANYDRRASLYEISQGNQHMIEAARSTGASAKFTGSGGAIVGTYRDEAMYEALERALAPLDIRIMKPRIAVDTGS
jgi:glucuronokinase